MKENIVGLSSSIWSIGSRISYGLLYGAGAIGSGLVTASSIGVQTVSEIANSSKPYARAGQAVITRTVTALSEGSLLKEAATQGIGAGVQAYAQDEFQQGEIKALAWIFRRIVVFSSTQALSFALRLAICHRYICWAPEFFGGLDWVILRVLYKLVIASILVGLLDNTFSLSFHSYNWAESIRNRFHSPIDYVSMVKDTSKVARTFSISKPWEQLTIGVGIAFLTYWRYEISFWLMDLATDMVLMTIIRFKFPTPWEWIAHRVFICTWKPMIYLGLTRDSSEDLGKFEMLSDDPLDEVEEVIQYEDVVFIDNYSKEIE